LSVFRSQHFVAVWWQALWDYCSSAFAVVGTRAKPPKA
jgi:hypothetical protein